MKCLIDTMWARYNIFTSFLSTAKLPHLPLHIQVFGRRVVSRYRRALLRHRKSGREDWKGKGGARLFMSGRFSSLRVPRLAGWPKICVFKRSAKLGDILRLLSCVQISTEAHPASYPTGIGGSFPGVKRGRGVTLTTHLHLVPRSRMSRMYTSSLP